MEARYPDQSDIQCWGTVEECGSIRSFRDLLVWQKGMDLADSVYEVTEDFPQTELFGLTSQLRRSAVSVPSNIAEGYGRRALGDYLRFLNIAYGSLCELDTQLEIAKRRSFLLPVVHESVDGILRELERMLSSLIRALSRRT